MISIDIIAGRREGDSRLHIELPGTRLWPTFRAGWFGLGHTNVKLGKGMFDNFGPYAPMLIINTPVTHFSCNPTGMWPK